MKNSPRTNILFYIPNLTQKNGGIRQYAACVLNLFATFPKKYSFYILHENNDPVIEDILKRNCDFKVVSTKSYEISFIKKTSYKVSYAIQKGINFFFNLNLKFAKLPNPLDSLIEENSIDILHSPAQHIPDAKNVKLISTMHDVQELHFPEFFSAKERAFRAVHYKEYIDNAHAVVVSYNHIKIDIVRYFNKKPDDVYIALMKMDNLWFSKYTASDISFGTLTDIPDKYIFYPANAWYHKNHENLIRAVNYLKVEKQMIINVIFSGDNDTECGKSLLHKISSYNLESQIQFLGILDELKLFTLYNEAWGIVIPTLYEAGSFPLIESILMELPVICSNVTSLPETLGNSEFIFDPNNIIDIADKVEKLWNNNGFRKSAKQNTLKRQQELIYTDAANVIEKLYNKLSEN